MNNALHPCDSVARLHLPRKLGGRGLIAAEEAVDQAVLDLANYVAECEERLIVVARFGCNCNLESAEEYKKRKREERHEELKDQELHGQLFIRQIQELFCV